jgi:hypothetical protein
MRIRFTKRWNGFKSGVLKDMPDGAATLLIKRGFAERIDSEKPRETATQRPYAVAGQRSKAGK